MRYIDSRLKIKTSYSYILLLTAYLLVTDMNKKRLRLYE